MTGKKSYDSKKMPLFIVSGASSVGKTSACEILFLKESRYIVMESDLLWREEFDTPEDNYREHRETWMRVCASISQIGLVYRYSLYRSSVRGKRVGKAYAGRERDYGYGLAGKLQAF